MKLENFLQKQEEIGYCMYLLKSILYRFMFCGLFEMC